MKLVKEGRKYLDPDAKFDLGQFMQNFRDPTTTSKNNSDPNNKNKNKKENLTMADLPKVDPSEPKVRTYLKNSDSDD